MKTHIIKTGFYILTMVFLVGTFISCEEESNLDELTSFELSEPLLLSPEAGASLTLQIQNNSDLVRFEWEPAASTANFLITYTFILDNLDGDFTDPILSQSSSNDGTETFYEITQSELDILLSNAGVEPNAVASLQWGVQAQSISQTTTVASSEINIQRFDVQGPPANLFIAGAATEAGSNLSNALPLNRITNADGSQSNVFQLYTSLQAGSTFNFFSSQDGSGLVYTSAGGGIELGDEGITVGQSAVYRVTVDFNTETVDLFVIDRWSIVGNVIPNGWGGDVPLDYQGNGVWQSTVELIDADAGDPSKRFIFRANEDWDEVLKIIPDTENDLALEGSAEQFGFTSLEDVPVATLGFRTITLSLNGDGFSFSNEVGQEGDDNNDDDQDNTIGDTPEQLYLSGTATENGPDLSNALLMNRLPNADGSASEIFELFTSLTGGETYNFFEENIADATSYTVNGGVLEFGDDGISVTDSGVYRITVNFSNASVSLFEISNWSIVGNVIPDGWNGDVPLEYQGNGVFQSTIELIDADPGDANKRFVFRANEDWALVFKEIPDTAMEVAFEGTAGDFGFTELNDISVSTLGIQQITLTLNGSGYSYTIN